jgi:hypothetical protein
MGWRAGMAGADQLLPIRPFLPIPPGCYLVSAYSASTTSASLTFDPAADGPEAG